MAKTYDDLEFHLVEVSPTNPSADTAEVEKLLASIVRSGDAAFMWNKRPYVALVTTADKAQRAAVRLQMEAESKGLAAELSLASEPYPHALKEVADRVIAGWVKVYPRRDDSWIG